MESALSEIINFSASRKLAQCEGSVIAMARKGPVALRTTYHEIGTDLGLQQ